MVVDYAAFWLPKDGAGPNEYEDAFAPAAVDGTPRSRVRCAVADGASESAYARVWARQLVSEFAYGGLTGPGLIELPHLGGRWSRAVALMLSRDGTTSLYLDRKIDDGAFAAFLGLEFVDASAQDDAGSFGAIALGDCCFVQIRRDAIVRSFPLETPEQFNVRPVLVPSRPIESDAYSNAIARYGGTWHSGDAFYLMSDALACWFLVAAECGERPWRDLDRFARRDRAAFRNWAHALRPSALKNDDVTLVRMRLH
ncbi:MAG: protein phosphatase 2C domain-containing protein [Vulcanimicrobiaceae bacterium]